MRLRPPRADDFDAMLELLNASTRRAYSVDDFSEEELRRWLTSPQVVPDRDIRLAEEDGRLVGYVDVDPRGSDPVRWWCGLRVDPDVDAYGVASPLMRWAEERAGDGLLRVWMPSVQGDLKEAFERLGFALIRHHYRMEIALDPSLPEPAEVEGLAVRTLRSGEERAIYEAHQESFKDSWEHQDESFEEWQHWLVRRDDFDPSLWLVVSPEDEVAGIALCYASDIDEDLGWVEILAVRRPWRGRGLGRALLQHTFREFQRRGFARVGLGVDATSLTGANRLYESAGMRVMRQTDTYEKPVGRAASAA
jgi:mycothiol synthase